MSIRSLPLMVFAFILYNVVVLFGSGDTGDSEGILRSVFFSLLPVRRRVVMV